MSDSEDDEYILDDIKALQEVLTQKQRVVLKKEVKLEDEQIPENPNLYGPSTSETSRFNPSTSSQPFTSRDQDLYQSDNESNLRNEEEEEDEEEEEEEDNNLGDLSDPKAALNLNRKIISLLSMAQKRLTLLLEECKRRQVLIDQKIRQRATDPLSRTLLTIAGIPYFKDKQQFPAPKNQDAKIKARRGELQIINLPRPFKWTVKDRNTLCKAIYADAKIMSQEETVRKQEPVDREMAQSVAEDPLRLEDKRRNKKMPVEMILNMKHLVGPLGTKEFDWMKIAATDFNGRHSASECRAMWNVHVHPAINKGKWKKTEDSSLKALAEEYKFQNWDAVASQLGTNRSGYQCFIRFNANFKINMLSRSSAWSKEEDQKLTDTVNALRTGNFIPWGEVAKLMGGRRKQQIYMRWNYSLAPNIKKGRFTEEEDRLLLQGVARFGLNFTKISVALLPHRNTAQLNDHYRTLINKRKNDWSCEDDMKLVKLFDKLGNNWSAIAKEFTNKSRVQVRHRHTAIIRYLSRGLSIRSIPRWGQKKEDKDTPEEEILTKGARMLNEMSEMLGIQQQREAEAQKRKQLPRIDLELRDYFKGIYRTSSTKRGRNKKFYSHEELEERTKKLHVILNMLNANLDIPDDLEEEVFLTEKDKQLLTSLKARLRDESSESEARQKHIEYIRRKMFGSANPPAEADRFIPPLPFNGQVQRTRRRKLVGINYFPNGDKHLAEPDAELDTPEAIISLIGGSDGQLKFKKLEKIFICTIEQSPASSTRNRNRLAKTLDPNVPSTSGTVKNSSRKIGEEIVHSKSQSSSKTMKKKLGIYNPEMLIPPNYTTLLGFRGILLSKHLLEAESSEEDEYEQEEFTITPEGERALKLFEDRLIKLFKFPIELSEVAPPLLHGVQNGEFDDIDDNRTTKRKVRETSSGPTPAKRKPQLQNVSIEKIPEAQ